MRKLTLLLCSLLVLSQATGCKRKKKPIDLEPTTSPTSESTSKKDKTETFDPESPSPSASSADDDGPPSETWFKYEPEPSKFTILFPKKPDHKTTPTPSAAGVMTQHEAQASAKTLFYGLGWMDFPATAIVDPKKALDGARDGAVNGANGTIRTEKAIKLNGKHQGRDIVFDVSTPLKATGYLRVYIVGRRFYQTLVVEPKVKPDRAGVEKFQASFAVK